MKAVSRRKGGPFAASFHGIMIVCTAGLWIPVWLWARRGRKTVTRTRG
jgi:hypothetical protein